MDEQVLRRLWAILGQVLRDGTGEALADLPRLLGSRSFGLFVLVEGPDQILADLDPEARGPLGREPVLVDDPVVVAVEEAVHGLVRSASFAEELALVLGGLPVHV